MKITGIRASKQEIVFTLDAPVQEKKIRVSLYSPALGEEVEICSIGMSVRGDRFSLSRYLSGRDGITFCYVTADEAGEVAGQKYVSEIADSARTFPYPVQNSIKGLQIRMVDDAISLGIRHAAINMNMTDYLMEFPDGDNTLFYRFENRDFFFNKKKVQERDSVFRALSAAGITTSLILLNYRNPSVRMRDSFWDTVRHPAFSNEGRISLFDVVREEGCAYYRAFVSFLTERYTRLDAQYGRAVGLIIGNEANSQWIWTNAGEMPLAEYAEQYTSALRVAYQCAATIYSGMRVYCSLDHFWNRAMFPDAPCRTYPGRALLGEIEKNCRRDGDFPWHVAYHPYPEDLFDPAFWNDTTAPSSPDADRVTFKNLEVLRDFLSRPEMRWNGMPRRIILSEQGFHSDKTPEGEALQAQAYGRAYKKISSIPEIDSFILHAQVDNLEEDGLNLGLWRCDPVTGNPTDPKPIYEVFRSIDQKDADGHFFYEKYE